MERDTFDVLAGYAPYVIGLVVLILLASSMLFTVEQQTAGVVERFGKFRRTADAGLNIKLPFIEQVDNISLEIQQLPVTVETKTKDNVFVTVIVSVQYYVMPSKVFDAYYKLEDPEKQLTSYVFDVVRAKVPKIKLDDVFEVKDEIADAVKAELSDVMDDFGYGITKALVTDIDPDASVKAAMNEINAAQRLREAATEKGAAERVMIVARAQAEAESKALQGKGIADQRKAIVDGLRDSIKQFEDAVPGATAHDAMQLVLMTQYFDTLKEMGAHGNSNTILLPHSPGALSDLANQIRTAMISADAAKV